MNLTEEQIVAVDRLDGALCQFLNNASDEYDPSVWVPSVKRDFKNLAEAYNDCHKLKIMDLERTARRIDR